MFSARKHAGVNLSFCYIVKLSEIFSIATKLINGNDELWSSDIISILP